MPLQAAASGREAELFAMAVASSEIEAGLAQPVDGQILEYMTEREDAQGAPGKVRAVVLRSLEVFVLKPPLAGIAQTAASEIVARNSARILGCQGGVDEGIHRIREIGFLLPMVEVEKRRHQKGISRSVFGAEAAIAS